ncbi:MAG: (d)CMP kinase [Planctomycetota bacterium]|jgi:cytidylate kinase|nr:(d)CMP kinase [Planctomycetota bacterium]MDP6761506.1 (d)CMP kinase [Planctomycetota bacterium]MDP6989489.1 (d)CMP kinase [Planctomycetota bacterium]
MIIAIDGPAGAGKSTVARALARALDLSFLDTGAMYRAVTLAVLRAGAAVEDGEACGVIARATRVDIAPDGEVLLDGVPSGEAVRSPRVDEAVSPVSAHPEVRREVVPVQRAVAARGRGVVAEGRDTTTTVFPDADHKFYLAATPAERARRRAAQIGQPERAVEIEGELARRDRLDSTRATSPLTLAPDAEVVETDGLSVDEVVAALLARLAEGGGAD